MNPADYVGTPYAKLDCFALVRAVAAACFDLQYPKLEEYSKAPMMVTVSALTDKRWVEVDWHDAKAGDVVTLSPTDKPAAHVGILLNDGYVLHNDKKYGCIIQDISALRRRGYLYRKVYRWVA